MVSEIPKKIFKSLLGLIAISLSLTSIFATLSSVTMLSNPNNVQAGTITESPADQFNVPISINNTGFYDVTGVNVSIQLLIHNETYNHILMNKTFAVGDFPAMKVTPQVITFYSSDFTLPGEYIDTATTYIIATFKIDLYYIFGLMHLTAAYNQTITDIGVYLS